MGFFQVISQWAGENPGKTAGALIGFILGILLFALGLLKTLLILLMVLAGFFIGKSRDDNRSIIDQIKGLFKRE
jgi:uncharacterized membrane protein